MPELLSIFRRVAIVGPGLIGGSFSLALRKAGFDGEILGVGEEPYIQQALDAQVIDRISTLEDAVESADLCYLSGTVQNILETIPRLGNLVRKGCFTTDSGSTKRTIVEVAARFLPTDDFIGGHPMAGKEKRGAANAEADLFRERPYILTSRPKTIQAEAFLYWLNEIGARVIGMDAAQHDTSVAWASHLPQMVSTALALTLQERSDLPIQEVCGSGLLDMTRLAQSSPELWASILNTNRDQVVSAIDGYIGTLNKVRDALINGDLADTFQIANTYSYSLRNKR